MFSGSAASTGLVAAEVACVEPPEFVAVTTRRTVDLTMLETRPSASFVSPLSGLHSPPLPLHCCHW